MTRIYNGLQNLSDIGQVEPRRRVLPACGTHITQKIQIALQRTLYLSMHDDEPPAEVLPRVKELDCSSEIIGLYHVIARLMSLELQYGWGGST